MFSFIQSARVFGLFLFFLALSILPIQLKAVESKNKKKKQEAYQLIKTEEKRMVCVYYADSDHGQRTASGEFYDKTRFTAAHRKLPFGTKLKVRNLKTNKVIEVVVNDRGPFGKNRDLEVSRAAAEELDMIEQGVMKVGVAVVGRDLRYKKYIRSGVLDHSQSGS